jgi:hypothetical protein
MQLGTESSGNGTTGSRRSKSKTNAAEVMTMASNSQHLADQGMAEIEPGSSSWLNEIDIPNIVGTGVNIVVVDCNHYTTHRLPRLKPESTFDNMLSVAKCIISRLGPRDRAIILANHARVDHVARVDDLIPIAENVMRMTQTSYLSVFKMAVDIKPGLIHVIHPGSTIGEPQDAVIRASRTVACPIFSYYIGIGAWHEIAFHDKLRKKEDNKVHTSSNAMKLP